MKKPVIGCMFYGPSHGDDEKLFDRVCKKLGHKCVFIDVSQGISFEEIENTVKECDIIYNNSAEEISIEFEKTLESLGKKVIDKTMTYITSEDKWNFYVGCMERNIPVPRTELLSINLNIAKKELREFGDFPVILKRVEGTTGDYVEKADNLEEAVKIINDFNIKGNQRLPIIVQEFILSPSYRVTVIDGKIVQTFVKRSNSWKATGVYAKKIERFEVDDDLKKLVDKIISFTKIKVCGIDLLKKEDKWIALEVNSAPAFDFIGSEREKLIGLLIKLLVKESK